MQTVCHTAGFETTSAVGFAVDETKKLVKNDLRIAVACCVYRIMEATRGRRAKSKGMVSHRSTR